MVNNEDLTRLEQMAKTYRWTNQAVLFQLLIIFGGVIIPFGKWDIRALIFILPVMLLFSAIFMLLSSSCLGSRVMKGGYILPFILSFVGGIITAVIFTRLAVGELKKNGYRVGLISAVKVTENDMV